MRVYEELYTCSESPEIPVSKKSINKIILSQKLVILLQTLSPNISISLNSARSISPKKIDI